MNWIEAVARAVMARWAADAALAAACPTLQFEGTPKGTARPRTVFYVRGTHESVQQGETVLAELQFNVFTGGDSGEEVNDILAAIRAEFNRTALALTGNGYSNTIGPRVRTEQVIRQEEDAGWQGVVIFALRVK